MRLRNFLKTRLPLAIAFPVILIICFAACHPEAVVDSDTFLAMGGIPVKIIAAGLDPLVLQNASSFAEEQVDQWESQLSLYRPGSTLNTISNHPGTPVEVSDITWETLMFAQKAYRLSKTKFDITVGPLIRLWKKCEKENRLPSDEELNNVRKYTGFNHLILSNRTQSVMLDLPETTAIEVEPDNSNRYSIDTGGIAKGLFAEWIHRSIIQSLSKEQKSQLQKLIINVGGDMYCQSYRKDRDCVIGIQNPFGEGLWGELSLSQGAVVTSGTYEREFRINNKSYCHIIDPDTGYPIETDLVSVTVLSPNGAMADALATTVFLLGEAEGYRVIKTVPDTELLVIRSDGSWKATPSLEPKLKIYQK